MHARFLRSSGLLLGTVLTVAIAPALLAQSTTTAPTGEDQVYESARHSFRVATVAEGLDHPWSMAWLPTGEMLLVERAGRLRMVRDGKLLAEPVAGVPAGLSRSWPGRAHGRTPPPEFRHQPAGVLELRQA